MIKQSVSGQNGQFSATAEVPEGNCFVVAIGPFDGDPNIVLELTMWKRGSKSTQVIIESDGIPQRLSVELDDEGLGISGLEPESAQEERRSFRSRGSFFGNAFNANNVAIVGGDTMISSGGAIAQGSGAVAVAPGGVYIGGNARKGTAKFRDSGDYPGTLQIEVMCAKPVKFVNLH